MTLPKQNIYVPSYEQGLPDYLQHDLDAYKEGLRTHSSILDCLWGELYGSINMAKISDGLITADHADYLRKKFMLPTAATLCYGFLTIRLDDMTILDFIRSADRYFITAQQYYEWD